jgi:hypothetical protein
VFSDAYDRQMLVAVGFVAAQVIVTIGLWRWPPYRLSKDGELV